MKYTIFSIDNVTDWRVMSRFMRFVDELQAMGKMKGKAIQCVGMWEGALEPSFLCRTDDYLEHIDGSGYVDKQDAIMQVSECNKQYAQLVWHTGERESIGSLKSVSKDEAWQQEGFTYRPDLDIYWIAVEGNPDTVRS